MFWEVEDLGSTAGSFICVGSGKCYLSKDRTDLDITRELEDDNIITMPGLELRFKYL